MAGAPPLYGTCWIRAPVARLKSSSARWDAAPLPEDPALSGLDFDCVASSRSDRISESALTTGTSGIRPMMAAARRSRSN